MFFHIGSLVLVAIVAVGSSKPFEGKISPEVSNNAYISRLMQGAHPTNGSQLRQLDQNGNEVDISSYSLKFQRCQFDKAYDDELAENEDAETVLATKHFVVFRL